MDQTVGPSTTQEGVELYPLLDQESCWVFHEERLQPLGRTLPSLHLRHRATRRLGCKSTTDFGPAIAWQPMGRH